MDGPLVVGWKFGTTTWRKFESEWYLMPFWCFFGFFLKYLDGDCRLGLIGMVLEGDRGANGVQMMLPPGLVGKMNQLGKGR